MEKLIDVRHVSLTYPRVAGGLRGLLARNKAPLKKALDDVSFSLPKGDGLALIGLNGSGKSTLLRLLANIYEPDSGTVAVNGSIAALFNMGIGMRIDMSGRANIMLMGMIAGFSRARMLDLMPDIVAFSELSAVIDDPMTTYSQGMAMRLSFATITALDPEVLLLDEWIGAGDRIFRLKAEKRLEDMVARASGFVLASHNTAIVKRYCKTAVWLNAGKVVQMGPVEDVVAAFDAFSTAAHEKTQKANLG